MQTVRLRAVGYRRVSMREQVDGHSLDAQEKNIRDYVNHNDWELIDIYTDAGISAKRDSYRPSLAKLMQDAQEGKFDVVSCDAIPWHQRQLAGSTASVQPGANGTLPTERKKLLRKAIRAAFVRGDTFVALQPTEAFSPLVELSCSCGEGGIRISPFDGARG